MLIANNERSLAKFVNKNLLLLSSAIQIYDLFCGIKTGLRRALNYLQQGT